MKSSLKRILCLSIFFLLMINTTALSAAVPKVTAPTYFLANIKTGSILVNENTSVNIKPAEFSKIMTAILALEKFSPEDWLSFKQSELHFYNSYSNLASVKKGDKMTIRNHLQNMLLLYSDASATELAVAHSKTESAFVEQMNKKAAKIGMKNTVFASACGYDPENKSKTTVHDLFLLAKYAYGIPAFMDVAGEETFEFPSSSGDGKTKSFSSRNHLISKYTYSQYVYSACNGMLQSNTTDNGNFIATASKNGTDLVAIVINSPDVKNFTVYKDVINLLEFGYNNYYSYQICAKGDALFQLKVNASSDHSVVLVTDNAYKSLLPVGYDKSKITYKVTAPKEIWAPISKGEKLGTVDYYYNGNFITTVPLVAAKGLSFNFFALLQEKLLSKINTFIVFIIIVIVVLILILSERSAKRKAERKKREREIMKKIP